MLLKENYALSIVIPSEATPRERFAAEEAQKYLKLSLSINAEIITDDSVRSELAILIGSPKRNKYTSKYIHQDCFDKIVRGPEGFIIKALDEATLLIAGSNRHANEYERGTLYAVYELFERYFGCALAAFSNPQADAGEFVPRLKEISLDDIEYIKPSADRYYRTAIVQFEDAVHPDTKFEKALTIPFLDWLVKNRYNRILTWSSVYENFKKSGLLLEIEKRGLSLTVGHHESSRLFLPAYGNAYFPEHYYETHPEYFKLEENGKRFENSNHWGQWVFCSQNQNAIAEVSKNVISWLTQNPAVDIIAFWPNDGTYPYCTCTECRRYTKTENYCYFVNEVAKRVKKHHKNVKFDLLIYTDLWECPEGLSLDPCIIIDEATWHASGLRSFGKPDGSCLTQTFFQDNLRRWRKTGAEVVYYDYYMGVYPARQRIIPMADELRSIWKSFIEEDFLGSGTQIECFNLWNNIFNFISFARTGYDTSLTMHDNLKIFKRLFGEGGDEIEKIIIEYESTLDGQCDIRSGGKYLVSHIDLEKIYSLFDSALEKAKCARARNNIRLLRMAFRYTDLEAREAASNKSDAEYVRIERDYLDPTGELGKMCEFDSFYKNEPGYAIAFPFISANEGKYTENDKWYLFETKSLE